MKNEIPLFSPKNALTHALPNPSESHPPPQENPNPVTLLKHDENPTQIYEALIQFLLQIYYCNGLSSPEVHKEYKIHKQTSIQERDVVSHRWIWKKNLQVTSSDGTPTDRNQKATNVKENFQFGSSFRRTGVGTSFESGCRWWRRCSIFKGMLQVWGIIPVWVIMYECLDELTATQATRNSRNYEYKTVLITTTNKLKGTISLYSFKIQIMMQLSRILSTYWVIYAISLMEMCEISTWWNTEQNHMNYLTFYHSTLEQLYSPITCIRPVASKMNFAQMIYHQNATQAFIWALRFNCAMVKRMILLLTCLKNREYLIMNAICEKMDTNCNLKSLEQLDDRLSEKVSHNNSCSRGFYNFAKKINKKIWVNYNLVWMCVPWIISYSNLLCGNDKVAWLLIPIFYRRVYLFKLEHGWSIFRLNLLNNMGSMTRYVCPDSAPCRMSHENSVDSLGVGFGRCLVSCMILLCTAMNLYRLLNKEQRNKLNLGVEFWIGSLCTLTLGSLFLEIELFCLLQASIEDQIKQLHGWFKIDAINKQEWGGATWTVMT